MRKELVFHIAFPDTETGKYAAAFLRGHCSKRGIGVYLAELIRMTNDLSYEAAIPGNVARATDQYKESDEKLNEVSQVTEPLQEPEQSENGMAEQATEENMTDQTETQNKEENAGFDAVRSEEHLTDKQPETPNKQEQKIKENNVADVSDSSYDLLDMFDQL